ncbi:restriction endonuclease subunit S [Apibacter adventoris]|uniref:restriction endonuclease subunit S n=1 Tax=Apibacter adventoris TaxID=1679466 RepID=UPI000CF5F1A8|nr:restriction endonuclease subunit S [Apibacter adventoris]PQL95154.1 hypothetical protein C4S76_02925 [Apibacter adventoris]
MTENKNDIPKHWKVKKLGEVCTYTKGKKPSLLNSHKTKDCSIPYINIKAFEKGIYDEYTNGIKCNLCEDGDLLMVWDGARCGLIGKAKKGAVGSTLMKILPIDELDEEYLYHFIASKFHTINTNPKGVGIPHVEPNLLWNFYIPIPPLSEQKAIVKKIEELFSELDKGVEDLKTVQNQLKIYRQSLLKWAFEGKLTNDNVEDGNLPKGWKRVSIQDIVSKEKHALKAGPFGSSLKKEFYTKSGYKIYGQEQVIGGDPFFGDYFISEEKFQELKSNKVKPNDILISLVGTVGKVLILPKNCKSGIINPRLVKITLNNDIYLPEFFKYYFESPIVKSFYSGKAQGTTMDVLNLGIIKTIPFVICSISEQQKIIEILEEKLSVFDQMEQTIVQSLQQAESLRQSILKQAFKGKLITVQEEVPVYTPKKIPFYQAQLFAYIIDTSANNNIDLGEMTLAKNSYLIDKIYGVRTYFDYGRGHLGPYSIEMKSVLYGSSLKQFFKKGEFHIELQNAEKLFKYTNPYESQTREAMEDLSAIISQYEGKERSYQTELLATVCKVIEDIQTTDLKAVRASMKEWEIDLKTTKHKNKAEKFSESDTASCLNFIISKGWDKKLIK